MPDRKLMPGWTWVSFGDVVRISKERSKNPHADGLERYVGLEHLSPEDLKIRRWGHTADGTSFTSVFHSGQVLFGKRRAYQRKVARADFSGVCSSDIYVFEPKDRRLLPDLLPFICQTDAFFEHALSTSAGSLSPRTNWKSLANYEFALPSLEGQRRFAKLLWTIEKHENSLRMVLEGAQIVQRSIAKSRMTLAITLDCGIDPRHLLPEGWRIEQLGNLAHIRFSNVDKKTIQSEIPILLCNYMDVYSRNDIDRDIDFMSASSTPREIERFALKKGDVLITKDSETPLDIAVPALVKEDLDNVLCGYHLALIRPIEQLIDSRYLFHVFSLIGSRKYFYKMANGTTRFGLTTDAIIGMPILIPPLGEQI